MRDTGGQARGLCPENQAGYILITKGKWGGEKTVFFLVLGVAITRSSFALGGRLVDPMRSN